MCRLAAYQVFCWFAIGFITLGGTSSRAALMFLGCGLAITGLAAAIRRAAVRRLIALEPRA